MKAIDAYEEYLSRLEASLKAAHTEENTPASRAEPAGMTLEEMLGEGSNDTMRKNQNRHYLHVPSPPAKKPLKHVSSMEKQSRDTKIIILCITACALLLALIFAARLSGGITQQARHIMRLLEKISEGEYRARTPVTSNDELGLMAGSLNHHA